MRIVLIGPPGVGKTTQAELLASSLCLPHVSTGEVLRQAIESGTELGRIAASHIDRGQLVPDQVALGIIADLLDDVEFQGGWILDGFPRTTAQAEQLDALLSEGNGIQLNAVISLRASNAEVERRLLARNRGPDDQPASIAQRLKVFRNETKPVWMLMPNKGGSPKSLERARLKKFPVPFGRRLDSGKSDQHLKEHSDDAATFE